MSKILDQIKRNEVPAAVMHSAAKGALPLEPGEMLEILVYLTHNAVFAQEARMTLARWDAESAVKILSDPNAPAEVLSYYWMEGNRRPSLMPALIENPAISEGMLMELAGESRRETIGFLMASPRARKSPAVIEALSVNPSLYPKELAELKGEAKPEEAPEPGHPDHEAHTAHQEWHQEHAEEIAAEEGKPFQLVGEDEKSEAPPHASAVAADHPEAAAPAPAQDAASAMAAAALGLQARAHAHQDEKDRLTVLQRLGRMNASERVKAAFTGGREERAILIRDGARVVQMAVLASPKLTDPEIETFAAAKNVSENVLREIARTRRFMKNYNVGRNLVNNAKCPLDLSLHLIKNLMVYDLKSLRFNKGVPETIRNVAAKLYREKAGPSREGKRE
ncbi:MAG TPA: hypothetical protein VKW06_15295 [Candidatus Angelobacter sp.]|nr:hypothetical protein [Candidatus Angelobacter sp.]